MACTPRTCLLLLILTVACAATLPNATYAVEYSMPVYGRFGSFDIALEIPSTPRWAHDVVLNASLVWNTGQLWFQHTYFPDGRVYTFVESNPANVSISYTLPPACAGIAVGWTDYTFAPSSTTIVSAHTYFDPSVFSAAQVSNVTARQYAFRLALHELGRILGLGNVLDTNDIMNPLGTPSRATQPPMLSTLDLYAVHVLASSSTLSSLVIVLNTDQYQLFNAWNLLRYESNANDISASLESSAEQLAGACGLGKPPLVNDTFPSRLHTNPVPHPLLGTETIALLVIMVCILSSLGIVRALRKSRRVLDQ